MKSNIGLGLRRLSAVFWGFVGLLGVMSVIAAVTTWLQHRSEADAMTYALIGVCIMALAVGLHKVTCWVIAGFTSTTQ